MKFFTGLLVVVLAHAVSCGNVAIRMPYSSPAGVTYVDGSYHSGLTAGPIGYSAPVLSSAALPLAAAAPVAATAYAAVPTVQHVPGVADVPVTSYEAQPGVIQKVVDVAKPAVQTRRFEIRRPAIQKEFYDVEERVVVRPAGSAVVELDEPVSKTQKGPAVIQPAGVAVPTFVAPSPIAPVGIAAVQGDQISGGGIASTPAPVFEQNQPDSFSDEDSVAIENPDFRSPLSRSSARQNVQAPYPRYERIQPQPTLPAAQSRSQTDVRSQTELRLFTPNTPVAGAQSYEYAQTRSFDNSQAYASQRSFGSRTAPLSRTFNSAVRVSDAPQTYSTFQGNFASQSFSGSQAAPAPRAYSISQDAVAPQSYSASPTPLVPQSYSTGQIFAQAPLAVGYARSQAPVSQARFAESSVASARNFQGPEVSQVNQQRLIDLLTARGGVAEIGYARSGTGISSAGESGQVRGRVISATPAPAYSEPTDERVNTRRVVVSRPIETLQEVEVAEPVTKFERIQVNQPTVIKTARQDLVRVPTSVPVYGKALAPVSQTAVPLALSAPHHPWQ